MKVHDAKEFEGMKPRAVIGINDKAYEVVDPKRRDRLILVVEDEQGNKVEIPVVEMGKIRR